jgi:hypothetical protein
LPRADQLIAELRLAPHPEGGWYRRIFCSAQTVARQGDGAERAALTAIVYLLKAGETSRWHRVASDEAWHHYEGAPLALLCADPDLEQVKVLQLGPLADERLPTQTMPARHWQAARCLGEYALVGCNVAPGFEFDDFELLADQPTLADRLLERHALYADFL